jgi:hypothetical protein
MLQTGCTCALSDYRVVVGFQQICHMSHFALILKVQANIRVLTRGKTCKA